MLTLPKAKTLVIKANDGANSETIELTTKVGQMNPLLVVPSIIDMIRNTSVSPSTGAAVNTRIYGMTKNAYFDIATADGSALDTDPRSHATDSKDVLVKQLTPTMVGAKYGQISWDLEAEGLEDVLARSLGQHIMERRVIKEQKILSDAVAAADAEQAKLVGVTATATEFATGAHVEAKALATSDEAYDAFVGAISNFQKLGLEAAAEDLNKNYSHARGINKSDMIVLGTPEFEAKLLGKQGVFASESGNALFKAAGIKLVLGVSFTSAVTLPAGVDFVVLTTGINGAISHENVSVGASGKVLIDPDWSFAKRLDLVDAFTLGVVYPFQIFVHKEK